jgi:hypothetical protein
VNDDRKYRHRGCQDSGSIPRGERPSGPPTAAQRRRRAPGRGIDQDKPVVFRCKHWGSVLDLDSIGVEAVCRKCGASLHSCSQCTYFDTSARFECAQPTPRASSRRGEERVHLLRARENLHDLTGSRAVATPTTRARPSTRCSRVTFARNARTSSAQRKDPARFARRKAVI